MFLISQKVEIDLSNYSLSKNLGDEQKRNDFIATVLTLSDEKCSRHKAGIIANSATWNVGTGSLAMLFTSSLAVISHEKTVKTVGALATAITGSQSLVNKEVYAETVGAAILRAIDVARATKLAKIQAGMLVDEKKYTPHQAVLDMKAYHDSCSLMEGVVQISKALENRKPSDNEVDYDAARIREYAEMITDMEAKGEISTAKAGELKNKIGEKLEALLGIDSVQ
ncbi:MAG: hypothetical protein K6L73_07315 [Cellvibrionaceae bacterium]